MGTIVGAAVGSGVGAMGGGAVGAIVAALPVAGAMGDGAAGVLRGLGASVCEQPTAAITINKYNITFCNTIHRMIDPYGRVGENGRFSPAQPSEEWFTLAGVAEGVNHS